MSKPKDIDIEGEKRKPTRIGATTTVDIETGRVVAGRRNTMTLLPCKPGACQECAVDHPHTDPHNNQSMHYQYKFYGERGRWPTWTDAMAHCTDAVRSRWRPLLIEQYRKHGMRVPDDLIEPKPAGR